jgi:hypothetical protein
MELTFDVLAKLSCWFAPEVHCKVDAEERGGTLGSKLNHVHGCFITCFRVCYLLRLLLQ